VVIVDANNEVRKSVPLMTGDNVLMCHCKASNRRGRSRQVVDHKIGRRFIVNLGAVPCPHQESQRAGRMPHLDVASFIADHNAVRQIKAQFPGCLLQQPQPGFATGTVIVRLVWANVEPVQMNPFLFQQFAKAFMNAFQLGLIEIPRPTPD